jgi:hypothetical protein
MHHAVGHQAHDDVIGGSKRVFPLQINPRLGKKIDLIIRKMNGENIADSSLVANPLKLISAYINPDILYVLDGQPVENINNIDAESIFTVSILKPEAAFQLYGERGKNGAVIVLTKAP